MPDEDMLMTGTSFCSSPLARWRRLCSILASVCLLAAVGVGSAAGQNALTGGPTDSLPPNISLPVKVSVAMTVNKLIRIDEGAGTFTADVDIGYRWRDPRQAFDKRSVGIDRLEFADNRALQQLAAMWTPKMVMRNLSAAPAKETHHLIIYADGNVQHTHRLTGTFETDYRLAPFPFDAQQLSVRLASGQYGISSVDIVTEQRDLNSSIVRQGWKYAGWQAEQIRYRHSNIIIGDSAQYAEMTASLTVKRESLGHTVIIFVPMVIILLFPTIYLFDTKEEWYREWTKRLSVLSAAMLTLVTQHGMVILRYPSLPVDSAVLQMFRLSFLYIFVLLVIFITLYNQRFIETRMHHHYASELQYVLRWALPLSLAVSLVYLLISGINS